VEPFLHRLHRFLLLWGLCCAGLAAHAQPVFDIPQNADSVSLSSELDYLVDVSGRWRPDSGEPAPGAWQPLRERTGKSNFGFLPHPVWFRAVLRSSSAGDRIWVVNTPQLEQVEWWQVRAGTAALVHEGGLGPMQTGRVPPQRVPTLSLSLPANETVTVYMRVASSGLMQVPVDLWQPAVWQERERRMHVLLGAYFGLLVALLAYNGFLALRLRDQAYGHYLCFGLGMGVFQLSSTGFGPSLLWTAQALWTYPMLSLATTVFGGFSMLFTDSFLRVSRASPRPVPGAAGHRPGMGGGAAAARLVARPRRDELGQPAAGAADDCADHGRGASGDGWAGHPRPPTSCWAGRASCWRCCCACCCGWGCCRPIPCCTTAC